MEHGPDLARSLTADLMRDGVDDIDSSRSARSLYSSEASSHQVRPLMVVRPRDADEVLATLAVCRRSGVAITARGAGTSIVGSAIGPGVILDFSAHMNRIQNLYVDAATATVQPGVVADALQRSAAGSGLRFGPDPSSHTRCTVGGMIGNNACGSRALGYGRTSDSVIGLDIVTGRGERIGVAAGRTTESAVLGVVRDRVGRSLATIRQELETFPRQMSGYSLQHLLPENRFDVARSLVGSEGTLAIVVGASVRLDWESPHRVLVVLGYPSIAEAADVAPTLRMHRPTAPSPTW